MSPLLLAASVLLTWDVNPEPDIMLYRLYIGIQPITIGSEPVTSFGVDSAEFLIDRQYRVDGLDYGREYFFRVTAINANGLESGWSNEIQYTPLIPTPTPTPEPSPTPTPEPTPDHPGNAWGWWKK